MCGSRLNVADNLFFFSEGLCLICTNNCVRIALGLLSLEKKVILFTGRLFYIYQLC